MSANLTTLRLLRLAARLSLDEVGRRVGVSGSYMSRIERGFGTLPPAKERLWVAALAGVRLPESSTSKFEEEA